MYGGFCGEISGNSGLAGTSGSWVFWGIPGGSSVEMPGMCDGGSISGLGNVGGPSSGCFMVGRRLCLRINKCFCKLQSI